ncbi:restriction endonuclease subunit S [Vibrio cyclitrophicus]
MSQPRFMEKLLEGVKVEWVALSEIGKISGAGVDKKINSNEQSTILLNYTDVYRNRHLHKAIPTMVVTAKDTKIEQCNVLKGDIFFTPSSEVMEDIGNSAVAIEDMIGVVYSYHIMRFRLDNFNITTSMYINYLLGSETVQNQINKHAKGITRFGLTKTQWEKLIIPMPCPDNPEKSLEIQAEIVRILDTFTELTTELKTELTTELNARKKQYNFYRDKLLRFEEGKVEWKSLGELGEFIRGKRFTKRDYVSDGGIKVIHYGEIYTHYGTSSTSAISQVRADLAGSLRYAEPNDVIVASVGETVEDVGKAVAWLGEEKVAIHDDSYAIRHALNPKYLSYCLQTEVFTAEKAKHVSRGKVKRLLIDGISKVRIPVPYPNDKQKSLAEQTRIVAILDKFDTLIRSLNEDLPREIELRQKQYEYYRDLLLSLPTLEVTEGV